MNLLSIIKGTALNKGRARTWIENPGLADYGFTRGERVTITLDSASIAVRLDPNGKRVVCGKADKPLFDICYPAAQRTAMFQGAAKLQVHIDHGHIVITALGA